MLSFPGAELLISELHSSISDVVGGSVNLLFASIALGALHRSAVLCTARNRLTGSASYLSLDTFSKWALNSSVLMVVPEFGLQLLVPSRLRMRYTLLISLSMATRHSSSILSHQSLSKVLGLLFILPLAIFKSLFLCIMIFSGRFCVNASFRLLPAGDIALWSSASSSSRPAVHGFAMCLVFLPQTSMAALLKTLAISL